MEWSRELEALGCRLLEVLKLEIEMGSLAW